MDVKKRMFRRPVTTVFWLLLVTGMTLLFVVSFALYWSSGNLEAVLSSHHTTVAVRTDQSTTGTAIEGGAQWEVMPHTLSEEDVAVLERLPGVQGVFFHSLTGGYSPDFTPIIGVKQTPWGVQDTLYMVNESYDDVLAVVEITDIYQETQHGSYDMTAVGFGREEPDKALCAEARILELLKGNGDYVTLKDDLVNLQVNTIGEAAADYLLEGQRYLVRGIYNPEVTGAIDYPEYVHPSILVEKTCMLRDDQLWHMGRMSSAADDFQTIVWLDMEDTAPALAHLEGSVADFLAAPANEAWADFADSYDIAQHSLPVMGTDCLESIYLFITNEAVVTQGRAFTQEEYERGAKVCLLSETMAEKSGLQVGSSFSMSQFLVHDFLENRYGGDNISTEDGGGGMDGKLNNPTTGNVGVDTEFVAEDEEFTVIGLYRLRDAWGDTSYSFTPNTVFIPKRAQIQGGFGGVDQVLTTQDDDGSTRHTPMGNGAHGVYLSVKLQNGRGSQFLEALESTALRGTFLVEDQGYGAIQESINATAHSAWELFRIALLGWMLILALYVLLYQGLQRKNLGAMRSQGSGIRAARRYLFVSGFVLAAAGVVLGTVAGTVVLHGIQDKVLLLPLNEVVQNQHSGGQALTTEALAQMLRHGGLSVPQLLLTGLAQVGIIGGALWIHAAFLARQNPRKLLRM